MDIQPEPPTRIDEHIYDSLTLTYQSRFHPGSAALGRNHPSNILHSPFMDTSKKPLWYLKRVTAWTPEVVLPGDMIYDVSVISSSDKPPDFVMKLNRHVIESCPHMINTSKGWKIERTDSPVKQFPLWLLGSMDRVDFIVPEGCQVYVHTVHIADHFKTNDYPIVFRCSILEEESGNDESIAMFPVTEIEWLPGVSGVSTMIIDDKPVDVLPHALVDKLSDGWLSWSFNVDSPDTPDRLETPGVCCKKIKIQGAKDTRIRVVRILELHGRGTDIKEIEIVMK